MKRIGVFFGQERSFPYALVARINDMKIDGIVAEPVQIGGISLETPKKYDLVLDRISQDIPYYRAVMKKMAVDGTIVVNNPFWWSADDKFFNNVVAKGLGVAVPKTVILPSFSHPPDTTAESMTNLMFPLNWDEIFDHIGFPAYFKPYSGGGWKKVYRVTNPTEFFEAYHETADTVMTLQEEIVFEEYYRCYAIGKKYIRIMPYDPRQSHFDRYVKDPRDMDPKMHDRIHADILKLVGALGYDFDTLEFAVRGGIPYAIDFLNAAPDADVKSVGQANFDWVLEHAAKWLVERVQQGAEPVREFHWKKFLVDLDTRPVATPKASAEKPKRTSAKAAIEEVAAAAAPAKPKAPAPKKPRS